MPVVHVVKHSATHSDQVALSLWVSGKNQGQSKADLKREEIPLIGSHHREDHLPSAAAESLWLMEQTEDPRWPNNVHEWEDNGKGGSADTLAPNRLGFL